MDCIDWSRMKVSMFEDRGVCVCEVVCVCVSARMSLVIMYMTNWFLSSK